MRILENKYISNVSAGNIIDPHFIAAGVVAVEIVDTFIPSVCDNNPESNVCTIEKLGRLSNSIAAFMLVLASDDEGWSF